MDYNKIVVRFRLLWAGIPHQVQAAIVVFAAASFATLTKFYTDPSAACWQWTCVRHYIIAAGSAGIGALKAFYMLPNGSGKAFLETQAKTLQAKADAYRNVIDDHNGKSAPSSPAIPIPGSQPAIRPISPFGGVVKVIT